MENNTTELVFILDRSGSMSGLEKDTIGGFNGMIGKQRKQEGECYVTTFLFDDRTEFLHDRLRLNDVTEMTEDQYYVRGCTALIDAIGIALTHIESIHRYVRPEDVPMFPRILCSSSQRTEWKMPAANTPPPPYGK